MKKIFLFCVIFTWCLTAEAQQKLTVLLDWFANPDHAPLIIAKEKGFFTKHHLDVTLIGPADPSDPPKLVAASKADVAITYEPRFMMQVDQGLPLIALGTLIDHPLDCLAVLQKSGITSIHDLKGKRIGYSGGQLNSIMLSTMLHHEKMSMSDIEHINVHYDLTQALLSEKVDAVTGVMRTLEVTQMTLAGKPARIFLPEKYGVPDYSELIYVINAKQKYDQRWTDFLAAIKEATRYLKQHPQKSWQLFIQRYPAQKNQLNEKTWHATLPYFAKDPGYFNKDQWQRFQTFMLENKMIHHPLPIQGYFRG
ncbi:MAG: ABC transporter substrate-binding protein [Gammaproteobacteria bacterium]|nr:ABC transporter substrate-binding protein [Gammaproteobacteria bacterium]